jgi:hypothetical protein
MPETLPNMSIYQFFRRIFKRGKKIKVYAIIFILFGILLLSIEGISREIFIKGDLFHWDNINPGWKSLLESIGVVFTTLGFGTLFLELGEFTEYFIERLTDVMIKDGFLEHMDETKMKTLRDKIESKLYFNGKDIGTDNFYHLVHQALTKLLKSYYYKELLIIVDCDIDSEKHVINKKIHKRIKVVNGVEKDKNGNCINKILIPFGGEFIKIDHLQIEDIYKIKSVIFKKENSLNQNSNQANKPINYTKEVNDKLREVIEKIKTQENEKEEENTNEITNNDLYTLILDFDYEFEACDSCVVEFDVETTVPISDIYYNNRLSAPCHNLTTVYNLSNNDYTLDGFVFSFLKDDYGEAAKIHKSSHSIIIKSSGWIMPGEGIVISMKHV